MQREDCFKAICGGIEAVGHAQIHLDRAANPLVFVPVFENLRRALSDVVCAELGLPVEANDHLALLFSVAGQ
ncbi:MAG TPA: hypothetical protein DCY59_11165 [Micrococcaceae bacterium]|nr:hypothetical protein [Micrococcaceae bacterium]